MQHFIAKNAGGKFHKAIGPRAAYCNSRTGIQMQAAHTSSIMRANPSHFCTKCFSREKAVAAIALAAYFSSLYVS